MSICCYILAGLMLNMVFVGPQALSGGPATSSKPPAPMPTSNANRLINLHRSIDGHVHVFFRIPRRPVATLPTSFWFGRRQWRKKQRRVVGSRLRDGAAAPRVMGISSPRRFARSLCRSFPPGRSWQYHLALPVCAILASHSIWRLLRLHWWALHYRDLLSRGRRSLTTALFHPLENTALSLPPIYLRPRCNHYGESASQRGREHLRRTLNLRLLTLTSATTSAPLVGNHHQGISPQIPDATTQKQV
jgi:hypothetical protein